MAEGSVTLSSEEARVLYEQLGDVEARAVKGLPEPERRALLRAFLKLEGAVGDIGIRLGPLGDTPEWIMTILRKTFIPTPAPGKKAAPKAAARSSARPAGPVTKPPVRKPLPKMHKGPADAAQQQAAANPALETAQQAINRSHRSTAEKAEAHRALNAGQG